MTRPTRLTRRRPSVESLEARVVLSTTAASPILVDPASTVLVRFDANDPPGRQSADLRALGATVLDSYPDGPEVIRLGKGIAPSSAVARLEADPMVAYATRDATIHVESVPFYPNDPAFSQLWGLNNANNVDIDAPEAYGVTIGSPSTIVAVLDTGIDLTNRDFAGKIWTNPVNDAASGMPNDVHGWNFVANTNNVQEDDGHGTHVSAIIAAQGNNGYGIVGVAPGVQIMPVKFLDADGNGTVDNAVAAIYYAVNHGARVINASWGGLDATGPLSDAISYANAHNVVFVTAAGNDGTDNDYYPSFPGSYRLPNELTVAAVDRNGALASFSNYGAGTVDLAAPGVDILSDVPARFSSNGLEDLSGTSMSTAYVTGVAALVEGLNPNFTAAQIVQRIDATTKALPSLAGRTISGGMVDAYNAVHPGAVSAAKSGPPAAGIPALVPGSTSQVDLHAAILASPEFFAVHGSTASGFVTGLYLSALGRGPDASGLAQWVGTYNSGTLTRFQMAQVFLESPEGRDAEVARWFQSDLGRLATIDALKADPGVVAWANLLLQGFGDDAVRAGILSSPEFISRHGNAPVPFVQGLFQDLTGRAADPSGQAGWSNLLYQGYSPHDVALAFLGSAEVADTLVATWFALDLGRTTPLALLKGDPGIRSFAADLSNR